MKKTTKSVIVLFICFITLIATAQKDKRPNIIIILTDDQGYQDVGFNGCIDIPTPNIDKIASKGVKFTNGYVSYAVCGPSRAGLITGRYQDKFGFGKNPLFAPNDPNMGLPTSEQTIATYLSKSGYQNLALGKWHLGAHSTLHPLKRGFTDFYGFLSGGHHYFPEKWTLNDITEVRSQSDGYKTKLLQNHTRVEEEEYLTDALSREAVSYIDKNSQKPFFIYLAYNAPHGPLQATEKYLKRFPNIKNKKRKTYAAMVSAVDDGVGLILNKLEEKGLIENTLVFFLSDNGGPESNNASDNGPLRGGKGNYTEGGIRVPFAMQWPAKIKAGTVYEKPIISLDIFATIVENCSPSIPTKNPLDGVNLIPYLTDNNTEIPHKQLFWRSHKQKAVRSGNNKLVIKKDKLDALFNLKEDLGETTNLKTKETQTYNQLKNDWKKWSKDLLDPVFLGLSNNREYSKKHPNRFIIKKRTPNITKK